MRKCDRPIPILYVVLAPVVFIMMLNAGITEGALFEWSMAPMTWLLSNVPPYMSYVEWLAERMLVTR